MKQINIHNRQEIITRNYFEYYDRQHGSINGFIRKVTTPLGTVHLSVEINEPPIFDLSTELREFILQHYKKQIEIL